MIAPPKPRSSPHRHAALAALALFGVLCALAVVTARAPELGLTGLGLTSVAVGPLDLAGVGSGGLTGADWLRVVHRIGFGLQAEVELRNPSLLLPVTVTPGVVGLQYAGLDVAVSTLEDVWVLPFSSATLPLSFDVDNILTIDGRTASAASEALAANLPLRLQVRFDARAQALLLDVELQGRCDLEVQLCPAELCHQASLGEADLLNAAVFAGVVASGGSASTACLAEQAASGCFTGLSSGERTAAVRVVSCDLSDAT
jgi:hypothetical protein